MLVWTKHCAAVFLVMLVTFTVTVTVQAGMLQFHANGEELATEGFLAPKLTRDGWQLRFQHIYVGLADITAYQTSPPYDAGRGGEIVATVQAGLSGRYVIDLIQDAGEDSLVFVGEAPAPAGHYNAISWKMVRAQEGMAAGYSMMLVGTAEKEGQTVDFELVSNEERTYRCGEFVGDERKGFLSAGGIAGQELTFHLDHIFGRADKAAQDALNLEAAGFEPFVAGGRQVINLKGLHIGHAGEGHCAVEWH